MRIEPYEITNKQENISNQTNQKLTNSLNTNKLDIIKNIMPLLSNNQNGNSPISSLLSSFAPQTSKVNPTNNIQSLSDKQNENNIQKTESKKRVLCTFSTNQCCFCPSCQSPQKTKKYKKQ